MSCEAFGTEYLHVDGETYIINSVTCEPIGLGVGAWAFFADLDDFPRVKSVWVPGLSEVVTLEPQHGIAGAYAAAGGNGNGNGLMGAFGPNYLLWAGGAALAAFFLVRR